MSKIRRAIDRMRAGEDLGLDRSGQKGRQRTINPDGTFNIERRTGRVLGNFYLYHWLLTTRWSRYWLTVLGFYVIMNILFAAIYYLIGVDQLGGILGNDAFTQFLYCVFFSAQSFTTVGYGGIHPVGKMANFVAALEAFAGLMTFALATGTLYGRFSKPVSRIKYSDNILIAPFNGATGMQFMVANEMNASLVELEVRVNISWFEADENGVTARRFQQVKLQLDKIAMFPTNWVINHPIDEESALFGRTLEEIQKMDFEVFVLLKGFDDVFSQSIYSRHSFMAGSFIYGAKFKTPFFIDGEGKTVIDITKIGEYERVELPTLQLSN